MKARPAGAMCRNSRRWTCSGAGCAPTHKRRDGSDAMAGNVILITGTTGSGKTTTCQAWGRMSQEPYLIFGFDLLVGTLFPTKYTLFGDKALEGYHHYLEDPNDPNGRQACGLGPVAWKATQ